ncbi:hypothetical protein O0L34_g10833 [Tuta absoluta]|nr:hypothetical protein O0L34_g10833 [Tuta absoluta]
MQRSVSEKSRQQPSPHHHREGDTRSLERRASNSSINYAGAPRGSTPEGYREAETLRITDKLSKRRGSDFPQPVSTPPHQNQSKRRQSSAQVRTYHEERDATSRRQDDIPRKYDDIPRKYDDIPRKYDDIPRKYDDIPRKYDDIPRKHDDIPRKYDDIPRKHEEIPRKHDDTKRTKTEIKLDGKEDSWRPDPDTIRVAKCQDSPAKRLKHEAEPLKRAKGVGDSPRLTQVTQSQVKPMRPEHHKSSPNVASRTKSGSPNKREERKSTGYRGDSKRQESAEKRKMYTASSESELFECAILPIFHKLLTERHKSQPHGLNLSYGVSCPNISIKCDIVEYL